MILLVVGSVVFLSGAAIAVPRLFTEPDPQARLRMLQQELGRWRTGQPLYGLGPIIAAAGVGYLAADHSISGLQRSLFAGSCAALAVGALAWAWSVYLRATRVTEFAFGSLPGWPFTTYVLLTIAGIGLLAVGLMSDGFPAWLGWFTLAADVLFLAIYLRLNDIPPFLFYLLLLVIGLVRLL